jgi:hypothetical protein
MTSDAFSFDDELGAAKYLLREAAATLNTYGVHFVVVGGWSPLLFHSAKYGHPGTYDVDILLDSRSLDDGTFDQASEALLSNGYLRAPKNIFQAHRILRVRSEDLVFHLDFLNEREPENEIEMVTGQGRMKSVYTPMMKAVFLYGTLRTHQDFPGVRFPAPETFIATKAVAAAVKKRRRDAFDIFLTVEDQDAGVFSAEWARLVRLDGLFEDANGRSCPIAWCNSTARTG